jgi:hypothetical protein
MKFSINSAFSFSLLGSLVAATTLPLASFAASPAISSSVVKISAAQCTNIYIQSARETNDKANALNQASKALVWGGVLGGTSSTLPSGVVVAAVLGGSSIGSTGSSEEAKADFTLNIAQSIVEAQAQLIGPYTAALAKDLNEAIYQTGRFATETSDNNPLEWTFRRQLVQQLNGRKIKPIDLLTITSALLNSGTLCTLTGQPLTQEQWALFVVTTYVSPNSL